MATCGTESGQPGLAGAAPGCSPWRALPRRPARRSAGSDGRFPRGSPSGSRPESGPGQPVCHLVGQFGRNDVPARPIAADEDVSPGCWSVVVRASVLRLRLTSADRCSFAVRSQKQKVTTPSNPRRQRQRIGPSAPYAPRSTHRNGAESAAVGPAPPGRRSRSAALGRRLRRRDGAVDLRVQESVEHGHGGGVLGQVLAVDEGLRLAVSRGQAGCSTYLSRENKAAALPQ